jgi:glucose-6-phosphate 1-dehydrogenase
VWEGPTPPPVYTYEAGTCGPAAAEELLQVSGHKWSDL